MTIDLGILTTWPALVAVSVLAYSVSVLLQKVTLKGKRVDPITFAIIFQLFAGIAIGIGAILHGFVMPDFARYWPNFLLMIALYAIGDVVMFKSLKLIDASTFTILFASRGLWSIAGALLFLGEIYTWTRLLGALLIILSILVISRHHKKNKQSRGEWYGLLTALCFGIAFVNDAFIIQNSDVLSYETLGFLLPAIPLLLIFPKSAAKIPKLVQSKLLPKLIALSVLYAVSAVSLYFAYKIGRNAAQIAPLAQTTTLVTVILSVIFLKERAALLRKTVGAVLGFIGISLVG